MASDDLAAIYDLYGRRLYAVAFRLLGIREEAEECVQDLFVALAKIRARTPPRRSRSAARLPITSSRFNQGVAMDFALQWIECCAVLLLWMALAIALDAHLPRGARRWLELPPARAERGSFI